MTSEKIGEDKMFKESFVVDTDIIVDLLRGFPKSKEFFKDIENAKVYAYFSTVTEVELYSGKSCSSLEEQTLINNLFSLMIRVDLNSIIARKAGELRRKYDIPIADSIIAATAIVRGSKTVITKNIKHYKPIKDVKVRQPY